MSERSDITPDFTLSPRIIWIDAPSTSLNAQDAVDTLRSKTYGEASWDGMDNEEIFVKVSGKEELDADTDVGITIQFNDAKVAFQRDTTPTATGTVTTQDTDGITLIDSAGDFSNLEPGAWLTNFADESIGTVLRIDSNTTPAQLTLVKALEQGSDNQFDIGDSYKIWNITECELTGGNFTALDSVGANMSPALSTFGIMISKTSSASATISKLQIIKLQYMLESLRKGHQISGESWFVSSYSGNDSNRGNEDTSPFSTVTAAIAAASDGDGIFLMNDHPSGTTTWDEHVDVDKGVHIRGKGEGTIIAPTTDLNDGYKYASVYLGHKNSSLSDCAVKTGPGSVRDQRGVKIDADNVLLDNISVYDAHNIGVYLQSGDRIIIRGCRINDSDDFGIYNQFDNTPDRIILDNIYIDGGSENCLRIVKGGDVFIYGYCVFEQATKEGIDIRSTVSRLFIDDKTISGSPLNGLDDNLSANSVNWFGDYQRERNWDPSINPEVNKIIHGAR